MPVEMNDHWFQLCKRAAQEQDPIRFNELVHQICEILDRKQRSLAAPPQSKPRRRNLLATSTVTS